MLKGLAPRQDFQPGSKVPKPFVFESLVRPAQRIYYAPDGSERDTYIIDTNGGTCFNYKKSDRIDF